MTHTPLGAPLNIKRVEKVGKLERNGRWMLRKTGTGTAVFGVFSGVARPAMI